MCPIKLAVRNGTNSPFAVRRSAYSLPLYTKNSEKRIRGENPDIIGAGMENS
jgi:hypothetical protein